MDEESAKKASSQVRELIRQLEEKGLSVHVKYENEEQPTTPPTYTELWTLKVYDAVLGEIGQVTYQIAIQGLYTNLQVIMDREVRLRFESQK